MRTISPSSSSTDSSSKTPVPTKRSYSIRKRGRMASTRSGAACTLVNIASAPKGPKPRMGWPAWRLTGGPKPSGPLGRRSFTRHGLLKPCEHLLQALDLLLLREVHLRGLVAAHASAQYARL